MPEGAQITPISARTVLRLKSWLPQHIKGEAAVFLGGRELPSQVGAALPGPLRILSVGAAEWLIVSHEHQVSELRAAVAADLTRHGLALVDLTHGLAALEVRGIGAREVLSKGCGLDFDPRSLPGGSCARTRFAQIPLVIDCLDAPQRFELYIARSYFQYLYSWLSDAAA